MYSTVTGTAVLAQYSQHRIEEDSSSGSPYRPAPSSPANFRGAYFRASDAGQSGNDFGLGTTQRAGVASPLFCPLRCRDALNRPWRARPTQVTVGNLSPRQRGQTHRHSLGHQRKQPRSQPSPPPVRTAQHSTAQHSTAQHSTAQHSTAHYSHCFVTDC